MNRNALMRWLSGLPENAQISIHKDGTFLVCDEQHPYFEIGLHTTRLAEGTMSPACSDPRGHEWRNAATDDLGPRGQQGVYCIYCGADGDA